MDKHQKFIDGLLKLSKKEIIDFLIEKKRVDIENIENKFNKKKKNYLEKIEYCEQKIIKLKIDIEEKNVSLSKYKKYFNERGGYDDYIGNKIFISEVSKRGLMRTYTGILKRETPTHITIEVGKEGNEYCYCINKENIDGIKYYYQE